MCSSFCCQCETGANIKAAPPGAAGQYKAKEAAYAKWKAAMAVTADRTMKAFLAAHPQYVT